MSVIVQRKSLFLLGVAGLTIALIATGVLSANAGEEAVHVFKGTKDGTSPHAGLIADGNGGFYGSTMGGGDGGSCEGGCGVIYKLSPGGTEKVLYSFRGENDGAGPVGNLLQDQSGNLYGVTVGGGGAGNNGTVFKVAPDGTETVLYAFGGGSDGMAPFGALVADANGNLYGETAEGGSFAASECQQSGCGTIFELQPNGTKTTLYTFQGGSDGMTPLGGVILDGEGDLYGTTEAGGGVCSDRSLGCGTVFKIAPDGTETVLYAFEGNSDGEEPEAGLLSDTSGNLFGTTNGGGSPTCGGGCGTVFEIAAAGGEQVLYAFKAGSDGAFPEAPVIMDPSSNLYGTTSEGANAGTVFKLAHNGAEQVLFAFGKKDGHLPLAGLLLGKHGELYGTTTGGGGRRNQGVVFEVNK